MVEPATWRDDAPNRLVIVWEADDVGAIWAAKHRARGDKTVIH